MLVWSRLVLPLYFFLLPRAISLPQVYLCCCVTLSSTLRSISLCSRPEHVQHDKCRSLPSLRATAGGPSEWADINRQSDAVSSLPVGCYVKAVETDCREGWVVQKIWLSYCGSCIRNCSREIHTAGNIQGKDRQQEDTTTAEFKFSLNDLIVYTTYCMVTAVFSSWLSISCDCFHTQLKTV